MRMLVAPISITATGRLSVSPGVVGRDDGAEDIALFTACSLINNKPLA